MIFYMASHIVTRSGIFYFRARIPTHLVSAYGKVLVSQSLGTRDPKEAKVRARAKRLDLDLELARLEQKAQLDAETGGSVLYMSDADIELFCNRFIADILTSDELDRIKGLTPLDHQMSIDIWSSVLPKMKTDFARGIISDLVLEELSMQMRAQKVVLPKSAPSFTRLAHAFQQAQLRGYEMRLKRLDGEDVALPIQTTSNLTLADILSTWKKQRGGNPKTVRAFEVAFESLRSSCPTNNASLVKKAHIVELRNKLTEQGVTAPTVRKHLGFLRAAFQIAVDDDLLPINPCAGVKIALPKLAANEKPRLPLTVQELQKIFSSPVYQPGYEPRKSLGAACYWLPLMGLFEGARLEELAQLEVKDIEAVPGLGHQICIRREIDKSKRTKNVNSIRNIPVHPRLVKLGFLDYVKSVKKGRLFPALRPDKYGILSTSYSTWFGRLLDDIGIKDSSRVFHSFRHTFVQRAKEKASVVPSEVREAIIGHMAASKIESVYGSEFYPLEPQVEALKHIDWPELDLSHLVEDQR